MGTVGDHEADRARIAALEAELAEMRQQLADLGAQVRAGAVGTPAPTSADVPAQPGEPDQPDPVGIRPVSRRGLIAGAAGAVAAGTAAMVANATPAAANMQGESWTLGEFANSATSTTGLRGANFDPVLLITNLGTGKGNAAQFYVSQGSNSAAVTHHETSGTGPAAEFIASNPSNTTPTVNVASSAAGPAGSFVVSNVANSAAALSSFTTGSGPAVQANAKGGGNAAFLTASGANAALFVTMSGTGYGGFINHTSTTSTTPSLFVQNTSPSPAIRAKSPTTNLSLMPRTGGSAPTADTVAHLAGDLVEDAAGNLWVCVTTGTPGQWRKLAGPATAGALAILPTPVRVYDSRPDTTPAVGSKTPLVKNVARTVDLTANSSGVPAGALAAMVNLLVVGAPAGSANFTLWKNGAARPSSNTMVWGGDAGRFSTLAVTALDSAARAQVVSSVATDVVIDVVGYYR